MTAGPCPYCGVLPSRTQGRPKTCGGEECKRRWKLERGRECTKRWHANHPRPVRTARCGACSAIFELPAGASGVYSLCPGCKQIGNSIAVVKVRVSVESYVCAGCEATFERKATKGQRPRWCPACAAGRGWKKANPALRRAADARRRARAAIVTEVFAPAEIFERDRWRCGICRKAVRKSLAHPHPLSASLDHVIPLAEGGHHVRANVRLSHLRCNLSRGARGGGEQLLLIG